MACIDPNTAPSNNLALLVEEGLVEVMRATFQMSASFEAPIPNETRTDHLVNVTHRLNQFIDQTVLRNHDHLCLLFHGAIQLQLLHRELLKQIHRALDLRYRHVILPVNDQRCQDQVHILLEISSLKHLREIHLSIVLSCTHFFIAIVKNFYKFAAGDFDVSDLGLINYFIVSIRVQ